MASYMLPHRRGLGRDAQAATSAEKKREMAAMGISPSSNTDEPYTRERGLASAGSRAERRRAQEQARDAAAAAGGFVGGGPSPAAGGFVGGNPAPPPRGRPDDGDDDPESDRRPAAAPRKLKLSAQRLMRNALHAHNYGLHQNALEAFDAALGSPEGRSTDLIRAECMAHKAATLHAMGRHTDALACAEEAKRLDPKQPRAYFGLALARDGLGEPMKSMDAIQDGMRCQAKSGSIFDPVIELIKPKLQALTKLKDAAEKGNLPECEKLADRLDGFGFPAMKSLSSGEPRKEITVAHAAVDGGQLEVIAFLGARGFDLDVADCEGAAPRGTRLFETTSM